MKKANQVQKALQITERFHWLHWIIILASWVVTALAWYITNEAATQRATEAFEQETRRVVSLLEERMEKYEDVLWSGVAAMQLLPQGMEVDDWQRFTHSIKVDEKYPGINGLGVIYALDATQIPTFLAQQQQQRPNFTIRPRQNRQDYWPVTYVEPVANNYQAVGLDMSHEANRYQAALLARDTGKAQITAPIVLVQDAAKTPGFLFYAPFYQKTLPETAQNSDEARREQFQGLVYAPFIMKKLIAGTLLQDNRHVGFRISDNDVELYNELTPYSEQYDDHPMFMRTMRLNFYGREWQIELQSLVSFNALSRSEQPVLVLIGAGILDALLILMFYNAAKSNLRVSRAYASMRDTHMSFLNASGDGYWDWLLQEDYEYMSPRFWEIFGFSPEEKPHKPSAWQDLINQDDLKVALQNFDLHVQSKGEHPYEQEVRYRHKNGSIVTVLCRGSVVEWHGDKPIRMIGTHTDITELKRQSQVLKSQAKELAAALSFQHLLMDVNTDFIFVKNEKFEIVQANAAFLSLYPEAVRDTVIGFSTMQLFHSEQAKAFLEQDKKAFAEGFVEVIETVDFPNGYTKSLLTKKLRFNDKNGNPFIIAISRDISQIKRIEEELLAANQELEEFSYRTSHDLRSPLISSQKMLSIIREELQRGEISTAIEYTEIVQGSLEKLQNLVIDILKLAKVNHGEESPEYIDFAAIVSESLTKFEKMENFERIQFEFNYTHKHNPILSKSNVVLVLENLLSNTIKYQDVTQPQSVVQIASSSSENQFIFEISDNGLGIPEAARNKLFDMFRRFHPRTSFGSGLGLYMVKKSIVKLGGEVEYHPLETGSMFRVTLPLNTLMQESRNG